LAEIPGVTIDWVSSPRIIYIPLAVRTVSAQDLVDTLRAIESDLGALDDVDPLIYEATGKTALDESGTVVGITVVLLNAQIYFVPDTTPISTGTATSNTTASGRAISLIDNTATFITSGLVRGDTIYNDTTGALATIISVISETELESVFLTGGSRDTWLIGDSWVAYNQQQCPIEGGNVVAIDDAVLQNLLSPVLESPNVQIVRSSSSSATLQELSSIQYSSFNGGVTIEIGSANSGTTFPVGTPEYPVNNLADAHTIAEDRGFVTFFVRGNLTVGSGDFSDGHVFIGQSTSLTTINVLTLADVTNCEFKNATMTGVLDGNSTLTGCVIGTLSYVSGYITNCTLATGTITLGGGVAALFINCQSGVPGTATPILDMGGSGQSLAFRGYNGGIQINNRTGTDAVSIDMSSGQVIVGSTVTNGRMTIRGITKVVDNSTGTAIVDAADAIVPARVTALSYQIEALGIKPRYGVIFYWDSTGGNDANDGTGPTRAVRTFAAAQVLCSDGRGDIIFIVNSTGTTVEIDERLVITKNDISIRGPGRGIRIKPSVADLGDTITINGNNVELYNFIVEAAAGNTLDNAITVNGRACSIQGMWINRAVKGLHFRGGDYHKVDRCDIEFNTDGVYFTDAGLASGSPREVVMDSCFVYLNAGDGIHLTGTSGTSTRLNRFLNCKINNNTGYGIRVDANTQDNMIDSTLFQNTLGNVLDAGTRTTFIESTNPWDALTGSNETPGTMGERIKLIADDAAFIKYIEGGRWKIDTSLNQMIFYKDDNVTEVARFNLKDTTGAAASTDVFERVRA